MNNIASIVVTYNRCDLLIECIEALKMSNIPVDILIIDNASTDSTSKVIAPYVDNESIYYKNTGKNLGGAGGFNVGLKTAYEMGYEYFWLMDDDTIVRNDTLSNILETVNLVGNDFGFISSLALWIDHSVCKMNHHYISSNWNDNKLLIPKGIVSIDVATFVSFFTRREIVKQVGFPIKDYFIWGDDTEYSLRISRSYPCYLSTTSQVIHKMRENQAAADFVDFTDPNRIQRMGFAFRNGCFTHRQRGWKKLLRHIIGGFVLLSKIFVSNKPYKLKKIGVLLKSYFYGLFLFHPKIEIPSK